jgi:hypothetical protein
LGNSPLHGMMEIISGLKLKNRNPRFQDFSFGVRGAANSLLRRDGEKERGSHSGGGFNPDVAAMCPQYLADDG